MNSSAQIVGIGVGGSDRPTRIPFGAQPASLANHSFHLIFLGNCLEAVRVVVVSHVALVVVFGRSKTSAARNALIMTSPRTLIINP